MSNGHQGVSGERIGHGTGRREALGALGLGVSALVAGSAMAQPELGGPKSGGDSLTPKDFGWDDAKGEYTLPALPYGKDALEPHIDAETMEIHHTKHHAAYVTGLNKALAELKRIRENQGDVALIKHWSRELAFHMGGHVNHSLFWKLMAPAGKGGGGEASGELAKAITRDFGSWEKFVGHFKAAATQVEGSGWAWLMLDPISKRLVILTMEKQQDLLVGGYRPIMGVDVWEHAYYVKYRNKRSDYVNAFMQVANWGMAGKLYDAARA